MNSRINNLILKLKQAQIDQMIISDYFNIFYLTGLKLNVGERLLVLLISHDKKPKMFVNRLFTLKENSEYDVYYYDDTEDPISVLCHHLHGKSIGIDKNWPSGFLIAVISQYQARYINGSYLIDEIRVIKDDCEQKLLIKASLVNDEIMTKIINDLYEGVSEKEIADKLKSYFINASGTAGSFEAIVAFGENGANPHALPSDRKLKEGDCIVIDMGGVYHNYCSDMTRTFFWKSDELNDIYDIVKQANLAAISIIRPGVSFARVDKTARLIIEEAGYGKYFTHRTGHGIGLQVHEPYDVAGNNQRLIQEGMCFSIEPGIYLPAIGGVRIEDLVLVKKNSVKVLNNFSKDKLILGN